MPWNTELAKWSHFTYYPKNISQLEKQFLLEASTSSAFFKKHPGTVA
jgi:hypothetical protein